VVYGVAARGAGFTVADVVFTSVTVFAGGSQFAAVGAVAQGVAIPVVVMLVAMLNARHLLYGAALAPWVQSVPRLQRAAMAYALSDEAFALGIAHFRRAKRADVTGYWVGAALGTWFPWLIGTSLGAVIGGNVVDPARLGLDVVFPAAMAGLAVGLASGRREHAAAVAGALIGVGASLALGTGIGIVLGGVLGPLVGLATPEPDDAR
jgi:4-azaleucine resistance transporter AzlC